MQVSADTTDPAPLLQLCDISRTFGAHAVLRNITLDLHPGETLAVIGESGCGKSVTLKLLMKLIEPSSGEVHWNGKPVSGLSARQLSQQRMRYGYLFQNAALFDSLTVLDNVAFGLRQNLRIPEDQVHQIVVDRLRDVGLNAKTVVNKKPAELSGGMRKRVALARALAMDPQVMLYDEPTTGLDPIMSDVINELILQTRKTKNMTSLVITHDMHTVKKVADRVVMFYPLSRLSADEPQIIFEGTPDEAFESDDSRVSQFVRGEARERLMELSAA